LLYKGTKGGGSAKNLLQKGEGGEFEHGLPPFAPAVPPLNNDPSLSRYCHEQMSQINVMIYGALPSTLGGSFTANLTARL